MIRPLRRSPRMKISEPAMVRLARGEKRCRGNLVDFSPRNCAVRISDPAFEIWTMADLKAPITVTLHGETRTALPARLQRVRAGFSESWILGMTLQ